MERKESRHGLELIKYGAIRLRGNFSALFMGAFAMVTPLVLFLLIPVIISMLTGISWIISIGVALFALFVGPLQMGYIKYFDEVIDGKQPTIFRVYSQIRFDVVTLRTIYIAILLLIMYIIGGVLWIVPAGFAISFYSMSLFFFEKFNHERLTKAMHMCATHMIGNRLAMFAYKLIFYLVYFMLFIVGGLCLALIYILAVDSMIVSYIVAVCSAIIFIFLYTMITVYYHSCNQIFFEDVLMAAEKKKSKKVTVKAEEKTVEDKKVESVVVEKSEKEESAKTEKKNKITKKSSNVNEKKKTTKSTTKKQK